MTITCLEKQQRMRDLFSRCSTAEAKYKKIIEIGREQPRLDPCYKVPGNLVRGCQSLMYLHSYDQGDKILFAAESDALVSSGLAALLIEVYSGETAETLLTCPPQYLEDLGLNVSLSSNRANGLYSIHLRMKQDALKWLMARSKGTPGEKTTVHQNF